MSLDSSQRHEVHCSDFVIAPPADKKRYNATTLNTIFKQG